MATVFKRPTSAFWFACYRNREGRQIRKSTKQTDKSVAQRMATEWERVEKLARNGMASTQQFQQVVNQVSREVIGESLPNLTIQAALHDWLESTRRMNAPTTYERYKGTVDSFLKVLGPAASQPVRDINPAHIERFRNHRLDEGVAPKTVGVDVKILSIGFRRAERFGYIDKNPVSAVQLPRMTSSEREIFTLAEIEKLIAASPNSDWQTMIYLGFYTGARLGDCAAMTWDNIDTENGRLVYQQRKTGKTVVVPLHARLVSHLHHVAQSFATGPLCPSVAAKGPGGKHGLSESFKRIVVRAGLDPMVIQGKGHRQFTKRTFHSLRHSFTSALASKGVSEEVRMKLTGHSTSDVHRKYTHIDAAPLKQAIGLL